MRQQLTNNMCLFHLRIGIILLCHLSLIKLLNIHCFVLQFKRLSYPGQCNGDVGCRDKDVDGPEISQVGEHVYKCIDTLNVYTNSRTDIIKCTYKYIIQYLF